MIEKYQNIGIKKPCLQTTLLFAIYVRGCLEFPNKDINRKIIIKKNKQLNKNLKMII